MEHLASSARRKGLFGGLAGVWLSSTIYGLIHLARPEGDPRLSPLAATLAVTALFPLSFLAWRSTRLRPLYTALGIVLLLPVALAGAPCSIPLAAAGLALLLVGLAGGGELLIVFGGAAVGGVGGFLACIAGSGPLEALLPLAYHIVSIGKAVSRVTGDRGFDPLWLLGEGLLALLALPLGWLVLGIVLLDAAWRVAERLSGVERGLSPRVYGLVETARILVVLAGLGLATSGGSPY